MTTVNQQYRRLNPAGANPREISEVVNNLVDGKSNNVKTVTLNTGWATSTTIYDERIGFNSIILLTPSSDSAEQDTAPYGSFSNNNGQLSPSVGATAVIVFDSTEIANGVYLDSLSKIYVRNAGTYNFQYSLELSNTNNDGEYADVWFRVNGVDVPNSSTRFYMSARKSTGAPSYVVGSMNFFQSLNANDYVEVAGAVSNTTVNLVFIPESLTIPRPKTPAVIFTVNYIAPLSMDNVLVTSQGKGEAIVSHYANDTADKTYKYLVVG
tara:strand:+ start:394 stop:1194 length:801 start_codon:yes stop_codon:yes gene_type:complete